MIRRAGKTGKQTTGGRDIGKVVPMSNDKKILGQYKKLWLKRLCATVCMVFAMVALGTPAFAATTRTVAIHPSGTSVPGGYDATYTSMSAMETAEDGNLVSLDRFLRVEIVNSDGDWTTADTTVIFDGWKTDRSAGQYVVIEVMSGARNPYTDGKWSTSHYRLSSSSSTIALLIDNDANADAYFEADFIGLQVENTGGGLAAQVRDNAWHKTIKFKACHFRGTTANEVLQLMDNGSAQVPAHDNAEVWFINTILENSLSTNDDEIVRATSAWTATAYFYNCTVVGGGLEGLDVDAGTISVKNTAAFNNDGTDVLVLGGATADYNASDVSFGTNWVDISPGAEVDGWNAAVTDYANGDYRVKDTSSVLYRAGLDQNSDINVPSVDIAGNARPTGSSPVSIGAFEGASCPTKNLVMVTWDGTTNDVDDSAKRTLFESWGWTVTAIDDGAVQATYDNAAANNDVMYISESVESSTVSTKAADLDIGIVVEENHTWDEMRFTSGSSDREHTTILISDNSHYITSVFSTGNMMIHSVQDSIGSMNGALASGGQSLATENLTGSDALFVFETGAALSSGTAVNRRVGIPTSQSSFSNWTADVKTIVQRSLDWAAGCFEESSCGSNLVMVVGTDGSQPYDAAKQTLFEGWGWTVSTINDTDSQTVFNNAAAANNVMYISESVSSGNVNTKARDLNIGIVDDECWLWDSMEYGATGDGGGDWGTTINITDNSHYITSPFSTGSLPVYSTGMNLNNLPSSLASGGQLLGQTPTGGDPTLFTYATGATLDSGTAVNRRVGFPSFDSNPSNWTANFETLLQRSLDWAAGCGAGGGGTNVVPAAVNDSFSTDEDVNLVDNVLTNDTLGDPLNTVIEESGVSNGVLTLNADGSFTYDPDVGFSGTDSFTYRLTDADNETSTATVSITVNPVGTPAPNLEDYSCNMKITINSVLVAGDLNYFPVLISLTDESLKTSGCGTMTDPSGDDLIFTNSSKTIQLDHEIEKYDNSTGELMAWVEIPFLSGSANTDIYMYYGNSNVTTPQENPAGVWDSDYVGVWHLKEDPAGSAPQIKDSTTNGNHGTSAGSMTSGDQVSGKIDGSLDFDGSNDEVRFSNAIIGDSAAWTITAWIKMGADTADDRTIYSEGDTAAEEVLWLRVKQSTPNVGFWYENPEYNWTGNIEGSTNVEDDQFHYVAMVQRSKTDRELFVDTVSEGTNTQNSGTLTNNTASIGYLRTTWVADPFKGIIDEVRVSNIARSAQWIQTEYNNQSDPSSFYSVVKNCPGSSPPSIAEYACSLPITIDSTRVSGSTDLTDFPVLIDLTNVSLKNTGSCGSVIYSNGNDIIFSDSTQTTQLDHEMVSYDGAAGKLVAWVRVPTLSATVDTVINLHFGNSNVCGPMENPTGVWDANYAAVWHLDEDAATTPPVTIDERISFDDDDSEEAISSGSIDWGSSDLELGEESSPQIVGMRWRNITIPQGATITSAYIEFTADEVQTGTPVNVTFWGEDADNAAVFENVAYNISPRTKTSASVAWNNVPAWPTVGETHQSPDISTVIQEIVNRPGWASGNALVVLVTGSGRRTADSHDSSPSTAALLHVEYSTVVDFHLDSTSNDNDGIPNGNTYNASGKIDGAQDFDGVDDWIQAPNSTSLDITGNQITLSAWVKMNATQTVDAGIINKSYSNNYNYMLNVQSNDVGNLRVRTGGTSTYLDGSTTLTAGQWYFLYGIYDGANAKVYLDGVQDGTDARTGNIESSGQAPVVLGRRRVYPTVDDRFFNGVIDEARISNVARSTDWMITEYNNQSDPSSFYSVGSSSCFLGSFTCNRKITVPQANVSGSSDLSNFPLLVKIENDCNLRTAANGGSVQNSNGYDIIFTASDGTTQLDHELVSYDGVTGDLVAWVKIPTLSASSDTDIYMYYGNSTISCDPSNPAGVWDSNYKGVWHLDETSGTHYDSTSNDNDATPVNGVSQNTIGKIDGADDFDGTNDYVDIGQPANGSLDFNELSDFCISAWFKADTADHNMTIVGQKRQSTIALGVYDPSGDKIYFRMDDSSYHYSDNPITLGEWYHVALCYDFVSGTTGNSYMYVNGVAQTTNGLNTYDAMPLGEWRIGDEDRWCPSCGSVGPDELFDGIIDEVRMSGTVRSGDWFKTSYDNQRDPSSFYQMSEDTCGGQYGFNFDFCKKITVDNTQVSGSSDLSDFPLLVNITSNDLRSVANNGRVESDQGDDIIFRTSDCTKLDHEIEKYDATAGTLVAWVRVPTLSYNSDTEVYMYYGDSTVNCPTENPTAVWDSNYQGVYHLKEDPSGTAPQIYDSTVNSNDGTSNGSMTSGDQVSGQIGGSLDFDSTNDYINMGNYMSSGVSQVTMEAWVKKTDADDTRVVSKSDGTSAGGTQHKMTLRLSGSSPPVSARLNTDNNVGVDLVSAGTVPADTWTHVAWTYDGSAVRFYIDGASSNCQLGGNGGAGNSCTPTGNIISSTRDIVIGNNDNIPNSRFFGGIIDEVRISDTARSADWIATQVTNHSNPNFYSVGSCFEQTTPQTNEWREEFQ
jgi:hypothetical protein